MSVIITNKEHARCRNAKEEERGLASSLKIANRYGLRSMCLHAH